MNKREIERLLNKGYSYGEIATEIGENYPAVAKFVKAELPKLARPQGRRVTVVADDSFMARLEKVGAQALAHELGVSISAVYRAKNRN